MSTDRQRNIFEMFDRTLVFNTENAADYASVAAAATNFATVQAAYDALQDFFAQQASGEASMAVEQKSILKAAIRRRMKAYAKTARGLKFSHPGIDKAFQVPPHDTETDLIAKGRDMVIEATKFKTELATLGMAFSRAGELTSLLDQLETTIDAKTSAQGSTVGATAGIDDKIDEGMEAAIILDAIMENFYIDDPVKLAEWETARHVKRTPKAAAAPDEDPDPGPQL